MSIICGTDLSAGSARALEVACALAVQRGDREVVLVHVVGGDDEDNIDPSASLVEALLEPRKKLEAQARAQPLTGALSIKTELVLGPPDETLVNVAEQAGSDLIVVAAQSRGERSARLGGTAEKIIAHTHVPVIAVRDPAPWLAFARGQAPLKILLGIDDSTTSDLGVAWTQALGARGPIEVVLGAIYYPDDAAAHYGLPARALVETDPEIERLLQRDLIRRYAGSSTQPPAGVTARARRGLGRIADHMIELAADERADVIVVGTGQRTGLGRLGSVSSVVVQVAPQSVVCVPPQALVATQSAPVLRGSLVATDLSPFANRAVPYSFALTPPDGEVHLLHVAKDDDEIDEAALVKRLLQLAPAGARQKIHTHIVRGDDTAETIAQCAARFGVDVICIASHGRSGLTRALVGSVADRVLRLTRLPVLVLRPQ